MHKTMQHSYTLGHYKYNDSSHYYLILSTGCGNRVVRRFASQSEDRGFDPWPRHTKDVMVLVVSSLDAQH